MTEVFGSASERDMLTNIWEICVVRALEIGPGALLLYLAPQFQKDIFSGPNEEPTDEVMAYALLVGTWAEMFTTMSASLAEKEAAENVFTIDLAPDNAVAISMDALFHQLPAKVAVILGNADQEEVIRSAMLAAVGWIVVQSIFGEVDQLIKPDAHTVKICKNLSWALDRN